MKIAQRVVKYLQQKMDNITMGRLLERSAALDVLAGFNEKLVNEIASTFQSSQWTLYAPVKKRKNDSLRQKAPVSISLYCKLDFGRMGNQYITLKHALKLCLCYDLSSLYLDSRGSSELLSLFDCQSGFIRACSLFNKKQTPDGYTLIIPAHHLFHADLSHLECEDRALSVLRGALRPEYHNPYDQDTLVVHIRAGDVFGAHVHASYHQPPLAWYLFCIRKHLQRHGSVKVVLVYEDRGNPCVDALLVWCKREGISVTAQSSHNVLEDYRSILQARALVDSYGTFTLIAKECGPNLKELYSFNDKYVKGYIKRGEWRNAPEQREMMIALPDEYITVGEDWNPSLRSGW